MNPEIQNCQGPDDLKKLSWFFKVSLCLEDDQLADHHTEKLVLQDGDFFFDHSDGWRWKVILGPRSKELSREYFRKNPSGPKEFSVTAQRNGEILTVFDNDGGLIYLMARGDDPRLAPLRNMGLHIFSFCYGEDSLQELQNSPEDISIFYLTENCEHLVASSLNNPLGMVRLKGTCVVPFGWDDFLQKGVSKKNHEKS